MQNANFEKPLAIGGQGKVSCCQRVPWQRVCHAVGWRVQLEAFHYWQQENSESG